MFRKFGITLSVVTLSALALMGVGSRAEADSDYCREYTRTVYIGNRTQDAYGTACRQSDGSWMIVGEGLSNDIPADVNDVDYIIHDNNRNYAPTQVVYYDSYPVTYRNTTPIFIWSQNGYYRGRDYHPFRPVIYRDNRRYDYRRYDNRPGWNGNRNDWHGNGRGDWHDNRGSDRGNNSGRGGYDPRDRAPWRDGRN